MKSEIIQYWAKFLKNPPKEFKEFFELEENFLKKNIKKEDVVLDVGCGDGRATRILSKGSKKVFGIDNDRDAIGLCKKNLKGRSNVKIDMQDAEQTSFKDDSFDVVVCVGATFDNFVKTKNKILLEIKRVLKDKGNFILDVYNENALSARLDAYKKSNYPKAKFIDEKRKVIFPTGLISEQFSEDEIRKILNEAGFEVQEIIKGKIFYLIKAKNKK